MQQDKKLRMTCQYTYEEHTYWVPQIGDVEHTHLVSGCGEILANIYDISNEVLDKWVCCPFCGEKFSKPKEKQ